MKKHCYSCRCQELKLGPWLPVVRELRPRGAVGRPKKLILYQGEALTTTEWSQKLGIARTAIENRLKRGWPLELVFKKFRSPKKEVKNVA